MSYIESFGTRHLPVQLSIAIRSAYAPLYVRNEFVHELNDTDLLGLVVEETGEAHDANSVKLTLSCIKHLKAFANFNASSEQQQTAVTKLETPAQEERPRADADRVRKVLGFNLGYTINLNLPATADAAVFDAIFKSLKQHLLSDEDV